MSSTQASICQRRGRETSRPRVGMASYLAAIASQVAVAVRPTWDSYAQSARARAGSHPVAPMADRIPDLAVLELIGSTHRGVPL
jgi:hypothetical protein